MTTVESLSCTRWNFREKRKTAAARGPCWGRSKPGNTVLKADNNSSNIWGSMYRISKEVTLFFSFVVPCSTLVYVIWLTSNARTYVWAKGGKQVVHHPDALLFLSSEPET